MALIADAPISMACCANRMATLVWVCPTWITDSSEVEVHMSTSWIMKRHNYSRALCKEATKLTMVFSRRAYTGRWTNNIQHPRSTDCENLDIEISGYNEFSTDPIVDVLILALQTLADKQNALPALLAMPVQTSASSLRARSLSR